MASDRTGRHRPADQRLAWLAALATLVHGQASHVAAACLIAAVACVSARPLRGWRYVALPLPPERFAETVRALPAAGFCCINVTIPHKEAALALA